MDETDVAPARRRVEQQTTVTTEREEARQRLQVRRDFSAHLAAYVVVNTFLIGIWATSGGGAGKVGDLLDAVFSSIKKNIS